MMRQFLLLAGILIVVAGTGSSQLSDKLTRLLQAPVSATGLEPALPIARSYMPTASSSQPLRAAPAEASVSTPGRSLVIERDRGGHFQVNGRVGGARMDFLVDTGASVIALTMRDANRIGVFPAPVSFTAPVRTANGIINAAPIRLASVDIGGLVVHNVQALVMPEAVLQENLLGMSYLSQLTRFEYKSGKLLLER
jgi:aspartyl protease family protein